MRSTSNKNVTGNYRDRARRRARIVARDGWPEARLVCCAWCAVPLLQDEDPDAPGQSVTMDRVVPGIRGGTYADDNLLPACTPCNSSRGSGW